MAEASAAGAYQFRTQFALNFTDEIIVDYFAGGGGASTGLEMGLRRPVAVAKNHNPAALSMHEANHPHARHLVTDVFDGHPLDETGGRPVGWFHASPDCTHHSQAAGGQPRKREIRNLSWVVLKWAGIVRPRVISLENVKQILNWGPLVAKRCPATGRVMKLDRTIAGPGERVPVQEQYLVPDKRRAGQTWRRFVALLSSMGYQVEWQTLCAADYGAPTTRQRLFMVARRDGEPIIWPEPTHAKKPEKKSGLQPWRSAAECIDWSIPCPSIFERTRPLAEATMRRIARGMQRYVLDAAEPFIVPIANWSRDGMQSAHQPLSTVTAWPRGGSHAVVSPALVRVAHGEGAGVTKRRGSGEHDPAAPLGTILAGGGTHAMATAFLAQMNGGYNTTHAKDLREPLTTVTNTGSQQQLVTAHLAHLRGNCDARDPLEPLHTISAGGEHHGVVEYTLSPEHEAGALRVAAFLVNYYGNGQPLELRDPLDTITTKDRMALVTVTIAGAPYVIVDIGLRMLTPRELYRAQGFPDGYIIEHGHNGRRFTKSEQVFMVGNSVSPPPMAAIARANNPWADALRAAA
ncbi:MAG: DNA cytosine methyltransferase [Porticoccaceae bacterium]|jgi:DNA (cytosine-5)-methyltransferase 1|nr:DNA cytosine methyltransferase [Porticoccaceae bacterium]